MEHLVLLQVELLDKEDKVLELTREVVVHCRERLLVVDIHILELLVEVVRTVVQGTQDRVQLVVEEELPDHLVQDTDHTDQGRAGGVVQDQVQEVVLMSLEERVTDQQEQEMDSC